MNWQNDRLFDQIQDYDLLEIEPISNRTRHRKASHSATLSQPARPATKRSKPEDSRAKEVQTGLSGQKPLPRLIIKLHLKKATPQVSKQPTEDRSNQVSGAMSRWGALLFATAWARKLIQGKNRRELEKQTSSGGTLGVEGKPSQAVHHPEPSQKRKASELEAVSGIFDKPDEAPALTAATQTLKRRRLFRANGEAVFSVQANNRPSPVLTPPELEGDLTTAQPARQKPIFAIKKPVSFWKEPAPAAVPRKVVTPSERSRKGGRFESRFNRKTREKALELKRQNKPVSQIEKLTGVAQRTLGQWFKDAGLTKTQNVNFKPHDDAKKQQAIELKRKGMHTERISERLEVSPNKLKNWFAAEGLNKERKTYDPAIKNQAMALYRKDTPIPDIASEMDVPVGRIYAWVTESKQANRKKPHSQETRQQVFRLYQEKKTIPAIVSATGVSEATVKKWLKEEGLSNRRKLHDGSVIEQAISRYQKGETRQAISETMNIPVPTLKKWLVKAGLVNHRS